MNKIIIKTISTFLILVANLNAIDIVRNNEIYYDDMVTQIASSGGAILFDEEINSVEFTNADIFEDLFRGNSINLNYNNAKYSLQYNGVDNIPNTLEAWQDDGNGIPELGEINYNDISYFAYDNIKMHISRRINKNFRYALKISSSNFHINKAYGFGLDLSYYNVIMNRFSYRFNIYDLVSFNWWDSDRLELYIPSSQLTINTNILNSTIGLSVLLNNNEISYKVGSKVKLSENFQLFLGRNDIYKLTSGFRIKSSFFCLSYAYMIPIDNLPFNPSQQFSISIFIKQKIFNKRIPLKP